MGQVAQTLVSDCKNTLEACLLSFGLSYPVSTRLDIIALYASQYF